ncbi:hypothetical protein DPMN_083408 [Dreissena polymorpha]|uniref:Uncharacterized protein n=2 Tax=Dreissena polymorpha TaxID=45954 RepID=A0A9D4BIF1_DREPO|nr:hypothetical protein DPMN_083408 [Dreissena polymorpha]
MYQNAYYSSDTNTSASSYNSYSHGRLSAPIISPSSERGGGASWAVPNTPGQESVTLSGLEGDVQMAFSQPSSSAMNMKNLRNDLLSAADSITGAMSSLVKELNSEQSDSDDDDLNSELEIAENYMMQTREDLESWQREVEKRLDQETRYAPDHRASNGRASNSGRGSGYSSGSFPRSGSGYSSSGNQSEDEDKDRILRHIFPRIDYTTDDGESYVRTDDESYTRTDDEDAELYDNHPKELPNEMTSSKYSTEEEANIHSDTDSYIRTDDEDCSNTDTDWEESMKRWINR